MGLTVAVIVVVTIGLMVSSMLIRRYCAPPPTGILPTPDSAPWEKGGKDLTMPVGGPTALMPTPAGARLRPQTPSLAIGGALLDDVVSGLERIPPFPRAVLQIIQELDSSGSSAKSVAEILASEPVLTAALLRVANSAHAGLRRDVVTVAEAVAYLGFSTVKALIMRLKLGAMFAQPSAAGTYESQKLWVHSMAVAHVAEELALRAGRADPQLAMTAGLLHDIGKVAINSQFPETVIELRKGGPPDESFLARERRLFGADHAFIGGYLAGNWKLPPELVAMVRLHHLPAGEPLNLAPEARRALFAVFVANQLAKYCHVYCEDMEIDIIPGAMIAELGLPAETSKLLDERMKGIIDRASALGVDPAQTTPPRKAAA